MCGNFGTYEDVVAMPLNGRVVHIDRCIHAIVAGLNAAGLATVASCCGHGQTDGRIDLEDGRVLVVMRAEKNGESVEVVRSDNSVLPFVRHGKARKTP